ncbi:DUF2059 domain-containing protein [Alistipes shahii]|uniref:DUF2059 domain-containing protein n=1 Tax=uncultured Alistipes sp. TaxID=538949 RepID=UPI00307BCC7A
MPSATASSTSDPPTLKTFRYEEDAFRSRCRAGFGGCFMDQLIPAIKQIVAFYESPVRKKLAAATSSMTSEGMQAGQQLGMEIAREMMQEMQQLGYK